MRWRVQDGVEWLEAELPGGKAAFSTRSAGSAKEDLQPLARALDIDVKRIVSAKQVHGADLGTDWHLLKGPGPVGLVYVADCLPVALAGTGGTAILHCGWRGLAAGIVARGVTAVDATHAAIGPGIGPCCYEVGDDVLDAFAGLGPGVASDRMLDLPEVARRLLREVGVGQIDSADLCTGCDERFFSHRRDGGPGRQAGLVWIEER